MFGSILGKVTGFWLGNKVTVILWAVVGAFILSVLWGIKTTYSRAQILEEENAILLDRNTNLKASHEHLVKLNDGNVKRWKQSQEKEYHARLVADQRAKERLALIRGLQAKTDYLKTIKRPSHEQDCTMDPAIVAAFNMLYPEEPLSGSISGGG